MKYDYETYKNDVSIRYNHISVNQDSIKNNQDTLRLEHQLLLRKADSSLEILKRKKQ